MTGPPIAPAIPGTEPMLHSLFGQDAITGEESKANQETAPNPPDEDDATTPIDRYRGLMAALYGSDFPLLRAFDAVTGRDSLFAQIGLMPSLDQLLPETTDDEWVKWARGRWSKHRAAVEMHLYLIARNRLYRGGQQWVSARGREPWREPPRPAEQARVVHNMIAPALDQRLQVITDQRPGFDVQPTGLSPTEKRKADGRQRALEFQYDQQEMVRHTREAGYWAGTDGVAFWHVLWDRDAGPWDERMGGKPLGDVRTETLRVEQVRVSANATANQKPHYVVLRQVLSEEDAAHLYGETAVSGDAMNGAFPQDGGTDTSGTGADGIMPSWVLSQTIVGEGNRFNNVRTAERFTVYIDKEPDILPEGLQLIVVGNAVVWGPRPLLFGVIPVARITDGSSDPSYYPRPIVEQWIPPQQRINAGLSLWVNSVRVNSGGRFLARPDAISRETFTGTGASILEVQGAGPLGDVIQPVQGFLLGQDVKDLIAFDVKAFEDMSGYNDISRGQIAGDASGRAILAAREQLERVFTPPVQALANAMTDWAKITIAAMAWGYDIARDVGMIGSDRPDLARSLSAEDFDGPATVRVDPETLIPMPRAFRLFLLDTWLERGLITSQQYMRQVRFASIKDLTSPDEDQEARAKRVASALRLRSPDVPPIRWQTNEAIEQDVLEREILLQDDLDPEIIAAADARWKQLAEQALMKQGALQGPLAGQPGQPDSAVPGGGGPGGPSTPSGGASPFTPSPVTQPLASALPSVATAPIGMTAQDQAAAQFEHTATQ